MKDIKGFENEYAVTKDGKIWSHKSKKFLSLRGSGKTGKFRVRQRKYKTIALWERSFGYKYFYVHRLVAQSFLPNPLNYKMVNHKDGNPSNNTVENLEWCTREQNTRHAFLNGLTTRGEINSQVKLKKEEVREIRKIYANGKISQAKLAKQFDVTQGSIHLITARKTWAWLN